MIHGRVRALGAKSINDSTMLINNILTFVWVKRIRELATSVLSHVLGDANERGGAIIMKFN